MTQIRRKLATSTHPAARGARWVHRALHSFSIPAPRVIFTPLLYIFLAVQWIWYTLLRVLIAEPFFKVYCTKYGRRLHTDIRIHWVRGKGEIVVGDDVLIDGRCAFNFAARFADRPRLTIGDGTALAHGCSLTIAKSIEIGKRCRIAANVWMFDSPGHPSDVQRRLTGAPPSEKDVRPIKIGDNVWIGRGVVIFPGVTIGDGSVIAPSSVVMQDIPANTLAAGNPARNVGIVPEAPNPSEMNSPAASATILGDVQCGERSVSLAREC